MQSGNQSPPSEVREAVERIVSTSNRIYEVSGKFKVDPIQVLMCIMFAGVIAVGVWHGRIMQENNRLINESIQVIKARREN